MQLHLYVQQQSTKEASLTDTTEQLLLDIKPIYPIFGSPAHVSEFVITTLYETLQRLLSETVTTLDVWYSTYRYVSIKFNRAMAVLLVSIKIVRLIL